MDEVTPTKLSVMLITADKYYATQFEVETGTPCIVGRSDAQVAYYPRVDLSDLGAYRMGISRKHATFEIVDDQLFITDHSSNGTEINGMRIAKDQPQKIETNSEIKFGELDFHLRYQ